MNCAAVVFNKLDHGKLTAALIKIMDFFSEGIIIL